jgi:hypothetical protein
MINLAYSSHLIAQTKLQVTDFYNLFSKTFTEAEAVDQQWVARWYEVFAPGFSASGLNASTLYIVLSQIGLIVALGALVVGLTKVGRDLIDSNFAVALPELIWPFVVVLLLSLNTASIQIAVPSLLSLIESPTIACPAPNIPGATFNSIINQISNNILAAPFVSASPNTLAKITLEIRNLLELGNQAFLGVPFLVSVDSSCEIARKAQVIANGTSVIQGYFRDCFPGEANSSSKECFQNATEQSQTLLTAYNVAYYNGSGPPSGTTSWIESKYDSLTQLDDELARLSDSNLSTLKTIFKIGSDYDWLLAPDSKSQAQQSAITFQLGFRQMLEAALFFTALAGPIAVAGSLLPVPFANKTIVTWFTGLLSIGSAKIFYNIVVGVAANVLVQAGAAINDPGWFVIFLGYVAPVFALGLATGGGVALWNGLQSGVSPLFAR